MASDDLQAMDETDILSDIEVVEMQRIKAAMKQIYSTWKEIGLDKDQKITRVQTAWSHIQCLIQDISEEEIAVCEELKTLIKDYTKKVSELAEVLSVEIPELTGLTLLKRQEKLQQEFEVLTELKENRRKELNELRNVEQHYCKLLGISGHKFSSKAEVPSSTDLMELKQHISMLTEEYNKRYEKYCQAKQQLSTIFETTEITPVTALEKHICSGKEPLSLSNDTFKAIDEIIDKIKKRQLELENQKKSLMDKLILLWNRLNIDSSKRTEFLSSHLNCKASTLKTIQQEIDRCEEIKRQNIHSFIDSVRKELNELWSKCGASDAEKQHFHPYFSTEMTEDVLAAHEREVERWNKYYEEVKFILEKIEKRNQLWELLMALDNKANDPARFKNRGGNLLKEERERNKLQKTLPTLESEIYKGIEKYEFETGKIFLYLDEDYRQHIIKQWQERSNKKENLKLESPLLPVTPARRPQFATPMSAPCPRLAIYRTSSVKSKGTPKSSRKLFASRPKTIKKRDQDILKEISKNRENAATSSDETAYSDFANEMNRSSRRHFRSSVVTSKKVAGTRTPNPAKKKRKSIFRQINTHNNENVDLTSVRGRSGLPFLM